jgi:hypothetical protein
MKQTQTFTEHQEVRSHFRHAIEKLKQSGTTVPELIEALRAELTLLHLEDDANADSVHNSDVGSSPTEQLAIGDPFIMSKPLGYYVSTTATHPDASIIERITERFGSMLQDLTHDDKATVLICLVEAAINPQQIFIQENFFSHRNGEQLWQLARELSPSNKLALSAALLEHITAIQERASNE